MNSTVASDLNYIRVAAIIPKVVIGNPVANAASITKLAIKATENNVDISVFPELSLTGYTCGDLFGQHLLLDSAIYAIESIAKETSGYNMILIVGAPIRYCNSLYNCAIVLHKGKILGIVPKSYLPEYGEFYEKRWFKEGADIAGKEIALAGKKIPFGTDLLFNINNRATFGVEICEDLWVPSSPSAKLAMAGAQIILNISATDENISKYRYIRELVKMQSASCRSCYAYVSAGTGESSTDLVFSGNAILSENGHILAEASRFNHNEQITIADFDIDNISHDRRHFNSFSNDKIADTYRVIECNISQSYNRDLLREISPHPFVPSDHEHLQENCEEIINIQSWGLEQRLLATGCRKLIIGISGGLDSTLALLVACRAFERLGIPRKGIIGITMPGEATTGRTRTNAVGLMKNMGITYLEIPINLAVKQHFSDIGQDPEKYDAAYENSQARERTQILMDIANKEGGMVLGTGDLSELALGWCTYNGDHMSMYSVNASVPKTLVKYLVKWFADNSENSDTSKFLYDIIDTPISPELIPSDKKGEEIAQKTEDFVGPYELHDFFLYHTLRYGTPPGKIFFLASKAFQDVYDSQTIKKWLVTFYKRFFSQQFKRSCMPDGPKVGSICLSPRGDWRMPSDAGATLWIKDAESI